MNWKGSGRKWLWSNFRYCSGISLEGLEKTTKILRIVGLWAILTLNLPNTKQQCHCNATFSVNYLQT
jgi:hypothetical protein